ncbi:exonuclease SbcC [Clostridium acetobutylicum]|uniref:Nuclease SbcCD subunit C n=2 Tax=Clostridium acetobutylicum TaxID=1488 RepID=SBCC_CLOAB|nr:MULTISPECIES: SMC family ATPase [Clostridium]Q97FK1.1 RecName: Full=Nuclease SbcCD subunit C [Clostridium acetobutylicum ATCC 824]AAK80682.1 ATPase involved in DNA repair [Clostridium acetobutylicum ATCC 824]ADZ21782.1 ATPase [Clostridium acetobutylicum EA 2018]AEI33074.1 ATPase involved in DNA repair [Clostridium acetobutylicum DSM 1731]AWV78904.1 SMC family ATPase [Clostridium acetobutylicum]MBC2395142.1 SMC family ATPase [Clostridium acetobutylicum]
MKPIRVRIKGLNSFENEQEINFEKLTKRGLFGIFGPTGSGKTTILDSITLSLYGEVARKSSNFMNTNCNSLNVSFEFQISGKEIKRYLVEREFRRDNKTGSVRSKSAKIVDITGDEVEVLEEGAKSVNEKCQEIIGLSLDDFTRTVVLPQGKFSEFLKLEGKERRNMLERLFNLQEYGDELSFKLARKIRKEREKENVLVGELKGYENINEDVLKERRELLKENNDFFNEASKEYLKAEEEYNEGKEVWGLQIEIEEKNRVRKDLMEKKDEIDLKEKRARLGESSSKVKPYIDNYENTLKQIDILKEQILSRENTMKAISLEKEDMEKKLSIAKDNKEKALPKFMIKHHIILDAIKEKDLLDNIKLEKKRLQGKIEKLSLEASNKEELIKQNIKDIDSLTLKIQNLESKIDNLKVPEEYKNKINEGIFLLRNYDEKLKHKNKLGLDCDKFQVDFEKAKSKKEMLFNKLEEERSKLDTYTKKLQDLNKDFPKDDVLLTFQEKLNDSRQKWAKYSEYNESLKASLRVVENSEQVLRTKKEEMTKLEDKISKVNIKIESLETENMAHVLREKLKSGEACPVCGSVHHIKEGFKEVDLKALETLKSELEGFEKKRKFENEEIVMCEASIKVEEKNIKKLNESINNLGEEFKEVSLESMEKKFNYLKEKVNKFNLEKIQLDDNIKDLSERSNKIEVEYQKEKTVEKQCEKRIVDLKSELEEAIKEFNEVAYTIENLKAELKIQDFKFEMKEILEKERVRVEAEGEIKDLRNLLNIRHTEKEQLMDKCSRLKEELSKNKAELKEKDKIINEKIELIKNKVGVLDNLYELKEKIEGTIKKIEEQYNLCDKKMNEIEDKYRKCSDEIIKYHSNLSSLKDRKVNDIDKLNKILMEEKFENIEKAKENYLNDKEINLLKSDVEKYKNELSKVNGAVEVLSKKLKNRKLTEEKWIEIQNNRVEKASKAKALQERSIKLEEEVKNIEIKLKELGKLLKTKQELEHKLSLLDDLEKLFKGKKFVEFVALNQLKYISIEASKRLKEITGGNYGLEVDDNGKFIIRDYKNGGAKRDASTLSGGETFVTSLALALSLSNQIQLRGSAPLELFFLDEGFGTLDSNLLEVVMDSLEKIHSERLSVGIISHLEVIKERMPVRLIVSPAEAGVGGSKVKLEIS